ncbi:MAG: fused MFS/spermidine synthase [Alphaproteobacteria bacterium]|nr:fused MFS/spermidine synthase [Alphaproteobacteria bacterium]
MKIKILVLVSGLAALSWETIWQIKSSLSLGVSAWGTAVTLAATMGGLCLGSLLMGAILKNKNPMHPLRIYAGLEIIIGLSGLSISFIFKSIEHLDSWAYSLAPDNAFFVHVFGIVAALSVPTFCMGATLPVLGLIAKQFRTSIATLYGLNTLGAAAGVLLAAFFFIPALTIKGAIGTIAVINFIVGILAWYSSSPETVQTPTALNEKPTKTSTDTPHLSLEAAFFLVFITGFTIFLLEVSWFRSFTAAFKSTTEAFAIMLSCVLLALGLGAQLAPDLKKIGIKLGHLVCISGIVILLATPIIERFDLFMYSYTQTPFILFIQWFGKTLLVIGIPVTLLGAALPWILDDQNDTSKWGKLYSMNAFASILGALIAGWILLPNIGFARTSWLAGIIIVLGGIFLVSAKKRAVFALAALASLVLAVIFESGVGRTRVQGTASYTDIKPSDIVEVFEGPEATLSVVQYGHNQRFLFIDGFIATGQAEKGKDLVGEHYLSWMGHLPMIIHPNPKNALVICFGTGQTANGVRKENPAHLDIVDINKNVFRLAHHFSANENVLEDPKVNTIVMDGRAYMRRTDKTYDVITLEPMPPTFAGVNSLYSREFYELAHNKLDADGVIAQWMPFHLVTSHYSASITRTFMDIFPNTMLWIDPPSTTGILIGSKNKKTDLTKRFPGFKRNITRDMSESEVQNAVLMGPENLAKYAAYGEMITDNNQLLSYGKASYLYRTISKKTSDENFDLLYAVLGKEKE